MYDFPLFPEVATLGSWIYQGLLFAIIFFSFRRSCLYSYNTERSKTTKFWFSAIMVLFVVTAFTDGDFAHYQVMVKSYSGPDSTGLESVYEHVIDFTNSNYFIFRVIFFGGMMLVIPRIFKNFGLDEYSSFFFLFCVYIGTLAYSRASIGMTFYFLGVSVLFSDKKNTLRIITGIALLVCSYFFHRSCIVLIPLTILALIPINKKTIPLILGVIVLTFFSLKSYTSSLILDIMNSENEDLAHKAQLYASGSSDGFSGNAISWIMHLWDWGVYYVLFIFDAYYILKKENKQNISKAIQRLFNISFGILLFALMMRAFDITSFAVYYRYLFMLMFPTAIMTTYLYQKGFMPLKSFKFLFWFGCIPTIENIVYHIYYLLSH